VRKRLLAVAVVGTAAFAACMSALVGETHQLVVACGSGCTTAFSGGGSFDFGPVPLNTSVPHSFELVPFMPMDDDIVSAVVPMGSCGAFPITAKDSLPAEVNEVGTCTTTGGGGQASGGGTCTINSYHFTVTFTPTTVGQQSCTYEFTTTPKAGGLPSKFDIDLTGTGAASFGVSASPPSIDFGDIPINTSSTVGYGVTDTGTMGETITAVVSGSLYSTDFTAPTSFNGLETKPFNATCTAGSVAQSNPVAGSITFTDGHGSAAQIGLSCRPISTLVGISPSPIAFAPLLVGATGGSSFTVQNLSTTTTFFYTVSLDMATQNAGASLGGVSGFSVPPQSSSPPISITYAPTNANVGQLAGSGVRIHAQGSGSGSAEDRNVLVIGTADIGAVATSPVVVDFQSTCAGVVSAAQVVNVYAGDAGSFHVTSITAPGQGFAISGGTGLAKGGHANDLVATVTASPAAPGSVSATAIVQTDIPADAGGKNTPTATLVLRANGLPAGVTVDQNSVHFNGVPKAMTSSPMIVTLGNCSASALSNVSAQIVGVNAADFAIGPVAANVASNASLPIMLTFTPSTVGVLEQATLQITYSGGSATVALDGIGTSSAGSGGKPDRETYYACASNRPLGLVPLALALGFVLRRRKREPG
jgi:hypothetical protein